MERAWLAAGAASMLVAVAAGAFGAHVLRDRLPPESLAVFETAVRYQAYHALAMLIVAVLAPRHTGTATQIAGLAFAAGTVLFSGSLYALALTGIRAFGAVTPAGGVLFLAGWLATIYAALFPTRAPTP